MATTLDLTPEQKKAYRAHKEAIRKRRARFQKLTPRERLAHVVNKVIDAYNVDLDSDKKTIKHDQGVWIQLDGRAPIGDKFEVSCDTAACVAGHTVALYGDTAIVGPLRDLKTAAQGLGVGSVSSYLIESCVPWEDRNLPTDNRGFYPASVYQDIPLRAQELLGLNDIQSAILFAGENTVSMIRAIALDILGNPGKLEKAFTEFVENRNTSIAEIQRNEPDRPWNGLFDYAGRFVTRDEYVENLESKYASKDKNGNRKLTRISAGV